MMECKNCGGELLFQNGKWICESCGTVVAPDSMYENIEVYICYEETDASGRRTKDSIIAQEVYKKLEGAKINAFYERISAGGVAGNDLVAARHAAMQKAKAIIVLGASLQSFYAIAEKYADHLLGKTVIPFCVDVEPGAIPKTLSKIQAVSYSTIGWDKDLIKGLYNLLGKEAQVDTKALREKAGKRNVVIICAAIAGLIIALALVVIFGGVGVGSAQPAPDVTQPPTPQQIYEQALALTDQGAIIEPLNLLLQIPEHPDSANKIKLLYAKFEGYYQADNACLHLDVTDNAEAKVNVTLPSELGTSSFSATVSIEGTAISGSYRDRNDQTGTVELKLEEAGIALVYTPDGTEDAKTVFFALAERSDEPIIQLDRQTLLGWLNDGLSYDAIRALGYDLTQVATHYLVYAVTYNIPDTEIYLTISYTKDNVNTDGLVGIQAPAAILTPDKIGKSSKSYYEGHLLFYPDRCPAAYYDMSMTFFKTSLSTGGKTITEDMPVGVTSKRYFKDDDGYWSWGEVLAGPYDSNEVIPLD